MKQRSAIFLAGFLLATLAAPAASVGYIAIDATIGPATADYIARATQIAGDRGDAALIVRLDTPGGLLNSTQDIVQSIYASPVPVVVHVAPAGANAGSAGCFITLAAHVAAMAPGTSIGAAHPVMAGGQSPGETMEKKVENFAASFIASIAQRRGRNVEWAESAVRESASITAEQAQELEVIDLLADDMAELLAQLDGREIEGRVLQVAGAEVRDIPMLTRERVFQMLWRPEVMFILMLVAIYGILGELSNPGAIVPGVAGLIALVLVLYMSAVLPVNIAGIALIVLAVVLFVGEALTPTFGLLTLTGVAAFLLGSLMLFDSPLEEFRLSLRMVIPATVLTAAFFVFVVSAGLRAQRLPSRLGRQTLIGREAEALSDIDASSGRVFVEGENWLAVSPTPVPRGARVEIVAVNGLSLTVKPKSEEIA